MNKDEISQLDRSRLRKALASSGASKLMGRQLGGYQLVDELSRGGMGIVARARRLSDGKLFALKLLLDDDPSEDAIRRFKREAKTLKNLDHPNIVKVEEFGHENGVPWFAMELIQGTSLGDRIEESMVQDGEPPPLDFSIELIGSVAEALEHLHGKGIIHRDLKPANIVIERSTGRAVLVDFGLVKRDPARLGETLASIAPSLSMTKEMVGTPAYMAPEQLDPRVEFGGISPATDCWGLGATLFACLTGQPPYGELSTAVTLAALASRAPPAASAVEDSVPGWASDICRACLRPNQKERMSIGELQAALAARGKRSLSPRGLALGLALIGGAVIGAAIMFQGPPPSIRRIKLEPGRELAGVWWLPARSIRLRAQLQGAHTLKVGKQDFRAGKGSLVDATFELEPGAQELGLRVGGLVDPKCPTLKLVCDPEPPSITVEGRRGGELVVLVGRKLRGQVSDDSPGRLLADGQELPLGKDGRFELELGELRSAQAVTLLAIDRAGNRCSVSLRVHSEKSFHHSIADLLRDRIAWNAAPPELQDLAISDVGRRLGEHFEALKTRTYRCPNEKRFIEHRIASFRHRPSGVVFRLIPGGRFTMGSPSAPGEIAFCAKLPRNRASENEFGDGYHDFAQQEIPAHPVTIKPFLMARFETSQEAWDRFRGVDRRRIRHPKLPIDAASWLEIKGWLGRAGDGLRLPSEAEWEYACRAGSETRYFWGDKFSLRFLWVWANSKGRMHDPAEHEAEGLWNSFGLVDMLGNVTEWVEDDMVVGYKGAPRDGSARTGGSVLALKVQRGGNYYQQFRYCRSIGRTSNRKTQGHRGYGFRIALSLPEAAKGR